MALGVDTQTDRHTHAYRHADQSNFKKPGVCSQRFNDLYKFITLKIFLVTSNYKVEANANTIVSSFLRAINFAKTQVHGNEQLSNSLMNVIIDTLFDGFPEKSLN